jgi:hypothetical protein
MNDMREIVGGSIAAAFGIFLLSELLNIMQMWA